MSKALKTILIISIIVFGGSFLLINSAQAGVVIQFGNKQIFVDSNGLPFNLNNFAPGMSDVKSITIENNENFDIDIFLKTSRNEPFPEKGEADLADVLTLTVGEQSKHISELFNESMELLSVNSEKFQDYQLNISFDEDAGNEYQGKTISFDFIITAEQIGKGNGEIPPVVIPGGGGGRVLLTIQEGSVRIPEIGETSVTITWLTSYSSTSQVIYAAAGETYSFDLTKTNYGYPHAAPVPEDSTKVTFHSVTITGLTSGTTYYYRCVSHGSLAISREYSFITKGVAGGEIEEKLVEAIGVPGITGEIPGEITEEGAPSAPLAEKETVIVLPERGLASMLAALGMVIGQSAWKMILVILSLMGLILIGAKEWKKAREKKRG